MPSSTSDVHSVIEGMDEQPGWWPLPEDNPALTKNWSFTPSLVPTSNPNTIVRIIQQSLKLSNI